MLITYSRERNTIEITSPQSRTARVSIGKSGEKNPIYCTQSNFFEGSVNWYATNPPLDSLGNVWVSIDDIETERNIQRSELSTSDAPIRVAVLVCGQFRERYDFSSSLENVLSDLETNDGIDLFITTWDDEFLPIDLGSIYRKYPRLRILDIEKPGEHMKGLGKYEGLTSKFLDEYKNNDPDYVKWSKDGEESKKKSAPLIFYKTKRGSDIIKKWEKFHGYKYDAIIRTRIDKEIISSISREFLLNMKKNSIYLRQVGWNGKTEYVGDYFIKEYLEYINGWCEDNYFIARSDEFHEFANVCFGELYNLMAQENTWISHILVPKFIGMIGFVIEENPYLGKLYNSDLTYYFNVFNSENKYPG